VTDDDLVARAKNIAKAMSWRVQVRRIDERTPHAVKRWQWRVLSVDDRVMWSSTDRYSTREEAEMHGWLRCLRLEDGWEDV
jgi:hypothetical protein